MDVVKDTKEYCMRRLGHNDIAEALRREMAGGRWRAGERLPQVAELAERFGAAEYAVRRALHLLRGKGLVGITKHVGAVVTDKAPLSWKGHVVFAHSSVSGSYYVHRLMCKFESGFDHYSLGEVTAGGRRVVAEFLANPKNRACLPDVVLFDDDYLTLGGISALLEAGLRIPGDIRVVAHSNKGNEPALGNSLARIESDPAATAEAVARYVLALHAGRRAAAPKPKLRFIPGESLEA